MAPTSRRTRLFRRTDGDETDAADLTEDEHAWWAAREEVAGVPSGRWVDDEAPDPTPDAQFSDYWTTESLFGTAPPAEEADAGPGPTAAADAGEPAVDEAPMDLDAAHLILQVEVGADWDDVTRAHRRLAKLYHPDRLLELSPVAQDLGHARMADINLAHAALRALHFR